MSDPTPEGAEMDQQLATVTKVTRTHKHDGAFTPIDVVAMNWLGMSYAWTTEPDVYQVGQRVAVKAPASPGACIRPAQP